MSPLRLLVVDQHEDDVVFLKRELGRSGQDCRVSVASNCTTAKEMLQVIGRGEKGGFLSDFIFIDLHLDCLGNGEELLGWIRGQEHLVNVPVVVMSGGFDRIEEDACVRWGVTTVLEKPVRAEALARIFRMRLRRPQRDGAIRLPDGNEGLGWKRLMAKPFGMPWMP